jgi:DNA invertase Pin-like site-specific DNA recombinase
LDIAKLDRLRRSVAFISTLMDSDVDFRIVDNPYAEDSTLHILAAVAENERKNISKRTTAALAAAKLRGVELGKHGRDVLSNVNRF